MNRNTPAPVLRATSASPYPNVRVLRQWTADAFGVAIDEDGTITAIPISDEQLENATVAVSEFDERGNLVAKSDFSGSIETARESYEYNEDGQLRSRVTEFLADELQEIETRTYDAESRLTTITIAYADGTMRTTTFTYDDAQHSVTKVTQSPEGIEEQEWTLLDDRGRTIERTATDPETGEPTHFYYEYTATGKISEIGNVTEAGERLRTERYTYDDDGEVLWEMFDDEGELTERRTTEYDAGRVLREVAEDTHNDDVITAYEYDDEGKEIHISTTAGTFARATFKLYDDEGRISLIALGDAVQEVEQTGHYNGGLDYIHNASTTWYEYE